MNVSNLGTVPVHWSKFRHLGLKKLQQCHAKIKNAVWKAYLLILYIALENFQNKNLNKFQRSILLCKSVYKFGPLTVLIVLNVWRSNLACMVNIYLWRYKKMLQCSDCLQWFHQECIRSLNYQLLCGDRYCQCCHLKP